MISKKFYLVALAFFSFTMVFSQDYVMRDLEGVSGRNAESTLQKRGYNHVKTSKAGVNIYSYWWRWQSKECVCARISDGEVKSVVKAPAFDCNKNSDGSARHHNRITHSSVAHHPAGKNYTSRLERQAFERGYRDGNHHKGYNNVYRNAASTARDAYTDGYRAGKDNRSRMTAYHDNNHDASRGYIDWHDLIGDGKGDAYNKLKRRGFKQLHAFRANNRDYRIYHQSETGQCIITDAGQYKIINIKHYTNCKGYMN